MSLGNRFRDQSKSCHRREFIPQTKGSPFTSASLDPLGLTIDPRGKFLYVADAMENSISVYAIDSSTGALALSGSATAGTFPDSVSVDPSGRFLFASNSSQSSTVSVFAIDPATGLPSLTYTQAGDGISYPYSIAADPSGGRVYLGNGSPSEVLAFSLNTLSGRLKPLSGLPVTGVSGPYSLSFDLSGSFLYVSNAIGPALGDSVSAFAVDKSSGTLTPVTGSPFIAGQGPGSVTVIDKVQ